MIAIMFKNFITIKYAKNVAKKVFKEVRPSMAGKKKKACIILPPKPEQSLKTLGNLEQNIRRARNDNYFSRNS
jgi:hypothetical protein